MLNAHQLAILDDSMATVLPRLDLRGLAGQRVFLTGGTGFFGLWLLTALRALHAQGLGVQVYALSRDPLAFVGRNPQFRSQPWLQWMVGNVRDFEIPQQRFDLLLHAATDTSMAAHADPQCMFDDIVLGTRQVLALAGQCGVRRLLLVSSGAVYGTQPSLVSHLADDCPLACDPLRPASAYGEGKRVMELMGSMMQQCTGIECVSARGFAFSGPGLPLDAHFALGNFVRDALWRDEITVQGDGSPMRSYLHGADLAVWLLHLLLSGQAGQSYNVGSDQALSIHELALRVQDTLAPGKPVRVMQPRVMETSERQRYVPAIVRARALGCAPWTGLDQSLRQMADYARSGRE